MKNFSQLLLILLLILSLGSLAALNQMELLTSMTGEFYGSYFGYSLVSMDFNGDGYDDLIVHSIAWNPDGVYGQHGTNGWGKTYCYWGGPDFDNVADLTFTGTHHGGYNGPLRNAGDVNGDGYDDLLAYNYENLITSGIFFGGPNPSVVPDILITKPENLIYSMGAYPLGDITGDGKADIALHVEVRAKLSYPVFYIWTGEDQPWYEVMSNFNGNFMATYGVGDVNNDGIDDFGINYGIPGGEWEDRRFVLYYGSQNFPQLDSLVIAANTNPELGGHGFNPVGDVNGDGIADFLTMNNHIWYGGDSIVADPDLALIYRTEWHDWSSMLYCKIPHCTYGDFNGDGYDDVVGSNYGAYYYEGEVGIWLGSANMDPNCDLYLRPPQFHNTEQFGWDKAAGDFNADGLCDLAISFPSDYAVPQWSEGTVFVYSGNADMVANEDQLITKPESCDWEISLYPSPFARGQGVYIDFIGADYKQATGVNLDVYNLKGQKVRSLDGISTGSTYQLPENLTSSLNSGMYIIAVKQGQKTLYTRKICIIK
ncbi:MAG: T9SS type A sorting domain-containing protein [Candidatus Cloacimonadaceae bacterium]|jgi:hypothetical protein|nr:T9SS type A sorting domain-containing protein [Candidatus Cloacimonadota bacterium]MCB5259717.1 T9SS type A sorting domain-containing protein [Candidatus Cloacimonadota bacterium]MCK9243150.1 T9SS type A sorting domain-containing protein [Candidatus Cloacimonadota bacterium]MDY0128392.1 T9SS type A sorting domain-containing protein [Candidatus Cloacimonadaceae bacterium]